MGKSNVLVTGGAGFIGSHLVEALLNDGHAVRVVDVNPGLLAQSPTRQRIDFIQANLADPGVAHEACRDIEYVFHEAAVASVPRSLEDPFATQLSGEISTLRVLEASARRGVKRLIFAASSSAYGDSAAELKSESQQPNPLSPYAASKLACEHYLRAYSHSKKLETLSLRYFNVFGPRQDPSSPYSAVVSRFLSAMKLGLAPHIHGDGCQTRDFTYVTNVIHANLLAMSCTKPLQGACCNIGCGTGISLNTLVETLNASLGTSLKPTHGPARLGDPRHSTADISLARELLNYEPLVSFSDGILRLLKAEHVAYANC